MAASVIGYFDDYEAAQETLRDLISRGLDRSQISVIGADQNREYASTESGPAGEGNQDTASAAGEGAAFGGAAGLFIGLASMFVPGVGPVVAGGAIAAALVGAVGGAVAGGILGALTNLGIPADAAPYYVEGIRRGGAVVIVQPASNQQAEEARFAMREHGAVDMSQRAAEWRARGWKESDPDAIPFSVQEVEQERERRGRAA
jgi:hypothetical protein